LEKTVFHEWADSAASESVPQVAKIPESARKISRCRAQKYGLESLALPKDSPVV
jgi:hypothetical protein